MRELENIKTMLDTLTEKEIACNMTEELYTNEPDNEEYEKLFDDTYKAQFDAYMMASDAIAKLLNIDCKLARTLVQTKRKEVIAIIEKSFNHDTGGVHNGNN